MLHPALVADGIVQVTPLEQCHQPVGRLFCSSSGFYSTCLRRQACWPYHSHHETFVHVQNMRDRFGSLLPAYLPSHAQKQETLLLVSYQRHKGDRLSGCCGNTLLLVLFLSRLLVDQSTTFPFPLLNTQCPSKCTSSSKKKSPSNIHQCVKDIQ